MQRSAHSACTASDSTKHDDCVGTMQINRSQSTTSRAVCCIICCFKMGVVNDKILYVCLNRGRPDMSCLIKRPMFEAVRYKVPLATVRKVWSS